MLGNLLPARRSAGVEERGAALPMSWTTWQSLFSFNGNQYQTSGGYKPFNASYLLATCGPVATVIDRRASVMGEARPVFQRIGSDGKPSEMSSPRRLEIMRKPWIGGTFRELVAICETDVAACGNSYWIRQGDELVRLEPDYVTIVASAVVVDGREVGERLEGYAVAQRGQDPVFLYPDEVAHYRPGITNGSPFRGESWLAAVSSDASSDIEMTAYKGNYLKNGAMPSIAVMYEPDLDMAQLEQFVPLFNEKFVGPMNAGKVMHLLGGRDAKTVGATLEDLSFKAVQGAGETRIASAAGVPAVVAGFSEGMQGSSLNAGNYVATRRLFADAKIRPLLGSLFDAFATIVPAPAGARLWFDDSGVSFFQEDVADEANIRATYASTIRQLIEAGYDADAAVEAVTTGRFAALTGQHSGLTSVQLQPPTDGDEPDEPADDEEDGRSLSNVRQRSIESLLPRLELHNHTHVTRSDVTIGQPEVTVHVPEQRAEAPIIQVNPTPITIDNRIDVDPTPITVENRVEPTPVNIENQVNPTPVTVENRVEPTPITNQVNPTPVNIENQVNPTPVNIDNRVEVEPTPVTVENRVEVDPTPVNVEVSPTPVTVENTVEPTPVTVQNQIDVETPPAQVTVVGDDRPSRFRVRRDDKGRITEVDEVD